MASVGNGQAGRTLIGTGVTSSPTFADIGTSSGLTQYGVLLAGGANAFTATNAGTSGYVLTSAGAGSPPAYVPPAASSKTTVFPSSGTWTKDARTTFIHVYGFNGGGSGASGRKGATTLSAGGGGGAGGAGWYYTGPASVFNTTETVTIAALTTGAIGQAADANNGVNGSAGNLTSFGNIISLANTAASGGGTSAGSGGASASPFLNYIGVISTIPGTGGAGRAGAGVTAASSCGTITNNFFTGSGGGGGGGYDTVTPRQGGVGGPFLKGDGVSTITLGGTGGLEGGTINGGPGNIPTIIGGIIMGATGGGGGGGPSVGTTPGAGGAGAVPGGGGGGGGGGITSVSTSGAGGNGAAGLVVVYEIF